MNIAFYISAHGYGHAAREQAVIRELTARGARVYVRSAAPAKFFAQAVQHHPMSYDVGMRQDGPMAYDLHATRAALRALADTAPILIEHETAFLRHHQIDLVAADMPPLACEIAAAAGVPCVVLTHFTWDWVYEHYTGQDAAFAPIVDTIRASYAKATLALQMQIPIPHPFTMFPQVEAIPGVANAVTRSRDAVRAAFNVPAGDKLALLSMGGHEWGTTDVRALQNLSGWCFLVTPGAYAQVAGDARFRLIPQDAPHFHDLIAAADVLIGKAGGSTVAEIIAHQTPMIYTVNENWRENSLLRQTLDTYAHSLYLPKSDFERGDWAAALESFAGQPFAWPEVGMDGADVAAARLLELI